MATIIGADTFDVRFPTSAMLDGSDAMNPDQDYSAAGPPMVDRPAVDSDPIGAQRLMTVHGDGWGCPTMDFDSDRMKWQ